MSKPESLRESQNVSEDLKIAVHVVMDAMQRMQLPTRTGKAKEAHNRFAEMLSALEDFVDYVDNDMDPELLCEVPTSTLINMIQLFMRDVKRLQKDVRN